MTDPTGAPVPTDKRLLVFLGGGEEGWDIKRKQTAARQQQGQAGLKAACRPKQLNSAGGRSKPRTTDTPKTLLVGGKLGHPQGAGARSQRPWQPAAPTFVSNQSPLLPPGDKSMVTNRWECRPNPKTP